jgi:serine/threonine protein kinase
MQDVTFGALGTLGGLPLEKEPDTGTSASDRYLQRVYPFKHFRTADVLTDVGSGSSHTATSSTLETMHSAQNTQDTLAIMEDRGDADEPFPGKPRAAVPYHKVTVPPAWGIHALLNLGYSVKEILGSSMTNVVIRRCEVRSEGQNVAVKCLSTRDQDQRGEIQKEYDILRQMAHENIVRSIALHESKFDMWLCMEYCHGTVEAHVNENGPIRPDSKEVQLLRELVEGVHYLHTLGGVAHRDLRPSSLLLRHAEDGLQLKVGGFSRARPLAGRVALGKGANPSIYSPPEVWLNHMGMEEPADIWSLGMCLCFMQLGEGRLPVRLEDSIAVNALLMLGLPERRWAGLSHGVEMILRQCLAPQPNSRPDAADLLADASFPGQTALRRAPASCPALAPECSQDDIARLGD